MGCTYKTNTLIPCGACPKTASSLYMCKLLQESYDIASSCTKCNKELTDDEVAYLRDTEETLSRIKGTENFTLPKGMWICTRCTESLTE